MYINIYIYIYVESFPDSALLQSVTGVGWLPQPGCLC